jgi:hypothetical protein
MKVFFDTNVYIAEALLGRAAERIIKATSAARWRIYGTSAHAPAPASRDLKCSFHSASHNRGNAMRRPPNFLLTF